MPRFEDLPTDIIPLILQHLSRPQHLASVGLVCKLFHHSATPLLYYEVSIFTWHRDPKAKATRLLVTLGSCSSLAKHVHKIVIRDFRKIRISDQELISIAISAISNLSNLRSCVWTRDGTMKEPILDALATYCPKLRELEINGRHHWNYDPEQLINLRTLTNITLLMPSIEVVNALVHWCETFRNQLRELTLISKSTSVINDDFLCRIAPHAGSLKKLRLAGCPKVSHIGVAALLHACAANPDLSNGLEDLRLEGVSSTLDLNALSSIRATLSSLRTFTLTFTSASTVNSSPNSFQQLQDILMPSPISSLNLYLTGTAKIPPRLPGQTPSVSHSPVQEQLRRVRAGNSPLTAFLDTFVTLHCSTLTRVALLRMPIPLSTIRSICEACERLEELFIAVDIMDLRDVVNTTALARSLRSIHVNVPAEKWGYILARGLPGSSWTPLPRSSNICEVNPLETSTQSNAASTPTNSHVRTSSPGFPSLTAGSTTTPPHSASSDSESVDDHSNDVSESESEDNEDGDEFGFNMMLHSAMQWNNHTQTNASPVNSAQATQSTNASTRVNRLESILDALGVPARLGPSVTQFGLMTRVWGVEYASKITFDGEVIVTRRLAPYDAPRVPDAFLVMMT